MTDGGPNVTSRIPPGDREFLARVEERDRMLSALDGLRDGSGRIVLLSGEAGLGKTRLVREVARITRENGSRVVFAAATDAVGGRPFEPLLDLLRALTTGAPPAVREAAAIALSLLSESGTDTSRWAQIDAFADALLAAAEAEPSMSLAVFEVQHESPISLGDSLVG